MGHVTIVIMTICSNRDSDSNLLLQSSTISILLHSTSYKWHYKCNIVVFCTFCVSMCFLSLMFIHLTSLPIFFCLLYHAILPPWTLSEVVSPAPWPGLPAGLFSISYCTAQIFHGLYISWIWILRKINFTNRKHNLAT